MTHHVSETLVALGAAFLVCGLVARAGSRIGLPTIPLFMAAGIVFGPHTSGPVLVGNPADLELVARLGLVFLLFYLGLEFTLDDLTSGGRRLLTAATAYLVLNVGGGLVLGFSLGWGVSEAFVLAGIIGISSTAIVTKLLVENRRLGNPETKTILGIAVLEDVFLAFYLALLQPVLSKAAGPREAVLGIAVAFAFLMSLFLIARYGAKHVGKLLASADEEVVVVVFVGLAIITAGAAELVGVSDAIGAFMVGLILGATARASRLRDLTHPLRDAFGAIFFFHVGLTIVPGDVLAVAPQIVIAAAMTTVLATVAGVIAARLHSFSRVQAANIGFTVLTRGEFSLILATLAVGAGLDPRIGAFAAGYVLLLAVVGPIAASWPGFFSRLIPARLFARSPAPPPNVPALELDVGVGSLYKLGADLLQVRVNPGSALHGVHVAELRLPAGSTLGLLQRDGATSALKATTQLQTHDVLVLFTTPEQRHSAERRIRAVHRSGRLATWRGDTGR
ncbi:cation:proton antiporter [Nocardioides marmoriginsengisoli]|uniref:cation:proton antiporter n=1 Tax=Nocardioides marmoriginsengisoli TaxID=661483 RepID=UPI00160D09B9|nr:cation:proton antiporter [Nocardioides marmoriginsengisoli]